MEELGVLLEVTSCCHSGFRISEFHLRFVYHCGGRCIVLGSREFKNEGKYARIREWVCTNNHEILSLMLYYPFALDGEEGKEDLSGTDDLHDRGGALGDLKSSRDKVFKDYSMG